MPPAACILHCPLSLLCVAAASSRDELQYHRLPPFTEAEATKLLVHAISARLPKAAKAAAAPDRILRDYSMTIKFLLEVVGCRPRRLLNCLSSTTHLMSDAELLANKERVQLPGELVTRHILWPGCCYCTCLQAQHSSCVSLH